MINYEGLSTAERMHYAKTAVQREIRVVVKDYGLVPAEMDEILAEVLHWRLKAQRKAEEPANSTND